MSKNCRGCGESKPLTDYYRHKHMGDGHLNYCKECVKERVRRRYYEKMGNPEWVEAERERNRNRAQWSHQHPHRTAHTAVSNALRDGRLTPADRCQDCGHDFSFFRREAHHPDYTRPLDVDWLCALCHGKRHRGAA